MGWDQNRCPFRGDQNGGVRLGFPLNQTQNGVFQNKSDPISVETETSDPAEILQVCALRAYRWLFLYIHIMTMSLGKQLNKPSTEATGRVSAV